MFLKFKFLEQAWIQLLNLREAVMVVWCLFMF